MQSLVSDSPNIKIVTCVSSVRVLLGLLVQLIISCFVCLVSADLLHAKCGLAHPHNIAFAQPVAVLLTEVLLQVQPVGVVDDEPEVGLLRVSNLLVIEVECMVEPKGATLEYRAACSYSKYRREKCINKQLPIAFACPR